MDRIKEIKVWGDMESKDIKVKLANIHTHISSYDTGQETWLFLKNAEADELRHLLEQKLQELDDVATK